MVGQSQSNVGESWRSSQLENSPERDTVRTESRPSDWKAESRSIWEVDTESAAAIFEIIQVSISFAEWYLLDEMESAAGAEFRLSWISSMGTDAGLDDSNSLQRATTGSVLASQASRHA